MNTELPPADPATPPPNNTLSIAALVLSLLGCPCILPGLVGMLLGFLAMKGAQSKGHPRPAIAVAAIAVGALTTLLGVGFVIFAVRQDAAREEAAKEARAKLAGRIDAATLDQQTACELAKVHILTVEKDTPEEFKCEGPFEAAAVAKLSGVSYLDAGDETKFTFCFAKAHRWYVIATPADGVCPEEAPPVPDTKPATEEAFEQQETVLRLQAAQVRANALIERFHDRVLTLRDVVEKGHSEKKCPAFKKELKVTYVDAKLVLDNEDPGVRGWQMLTHEDWRYALDENQEPVRRAEAIDDIQRASDVVVVFDADGLREWPVAEGSSYTMGAYEGWMTVVKLPDGEVLCETELTFESAETVGGGIKLKGMPDKSTKELIDDDFEDKFKDAATAKAKAISGGKLKLGLKFVE